MNDMNEKIKHLGWLAIYDFKDFIQKEERLRKTGDIFGNIPDNHLCDPLLAEKDLLQTWKFVFATLFDTNSWDVKFVYNNDSERYELKVNNECIYYEGGSYGDNT